MPLVYWQNSSCQFPTWTIFHMAVLSLVETVQLIMYSAIVHVQLMMLFDCCTLLYICVVKRMPALNPNKQNWTNMRAACSGQTESTLILTNEIPSRNCLATWYCDLRPSHVILICTRFTWKRRKRPSSLSLAFIKQCFLTFLLTNSYNYCITQFLLFK